MSSRGKWYTICWLLKHINACLRFVATVALDVSIPCQAMALTRATSNEYIHIKFVVVFNSIYIFIIL